MVAEMPGIDSLVSTILNLLPYLVVGYLAFEIYLRSDELTNRLSDIKTGARGLLFVPVSIAVLGITAYLGYTVSQMFQPLQWGWLGYNFLLAPVQDTAVSNGSAAGAANAGGLVSNVGGIAFNVIFFALIIFVLVLFGHDEERLFRDSWTHTGLWAVLHLIMGIPIWALIPIGSVGIVYKLVHDYRSLEEAYVVHLFTNLCLIAVLAATIFSTGGAG
jgi:membrane protease YdiL (CAAX protease family)